MDIEELKRLIDQVLSENKVRSADPERLRTDLIELCQEVEEVSIRKLFQD